MKYRITKCQKDERFWGYQPIDLRKKNFKCIHCKEMHETRKYSENKK